MSKTCNPDLSKLGSELYWHDCGQSSLHGSLLELFESLDRRFIELAKEFDAQDYRFPPFLSVETLQKLDYFKSFPHLISIPVTLESSRDNLAAFAEDALMPGSNSQLKLRQLEPATQVLTPAACYHFYDELQGSSFDRARYLSTRCVCFRRETEYKPLMRQWAFSMREFVCIGTMQEVQAFLQRFEQILSKYFAEFKFPISFEFAQDPFFNPASNPKYLMQKLEPVKKEMIYDGHLSIGSLNFHRNFFGECFQLSSGGEAAYSACVAFGLERWIYMIISEQGSNKGDWRF